MNKFSLSTLLTILSVTLWAMTASTTPLAYAQESVTANANGHGIVATANSTEYYGAWIENTGPAGAKGAYIRSGTGYTADIVLGGNDDSPEGDDGRIDCDRRFPGCDIVMQANDRIFMHIDRNGSGNPDAYFKVQNNHGALLTVLNTGVTEVKELRISGGADLAEKFQVRTTSGTTPEPGMVVSIDPLQPGELMVSEQAYDRRVAGIISGANAMNPGLTLHQEGTIANGDYPVALTGRVYVWADASYGAIQPGDLLTSSPTAGHAMKVGDQSLAAGATLGKAMTALDDGVGFVLVLVTLQ